MAHQWDEFFSELASFIRITEGREEEASIDLAEATVVKLEGYLRVLEAILESLGSTTGVEEVQRSIADLVTSLQIIKSRWEDIECGLGVSETERVFTAERRRGDGPGRPKVFIRIEQVEFLRDLRFTWTQIAKLFGISRRTLFDIRSQHGLVGSGFTDITDQELDAAITEVKRSMPNIGQSMMKGVLRAQGIHVPLLRIRQSLLRLDPVNTAMRWAVPITRRIYSVPGPNALWHLDGNHKLIRWRLVVHGAIDGFSRCILYLQCSNNKSSTVLHLFRGGVTQYGLPKRIRCDHGGENVKAAELMLAYGEVPDPVITGSSVHNQRIERLWRDVFRCVSCVFYQLFYYLEARGMLDALSEIDLYCLHMVYIPRINEALTAFVSGWNHHSITTEHSMTPMQLFTAGLLVNASHPQQLELGDQESTNEDATGIAVPETPIPLDEDDATELQGLISGLGPSENYSIEIYDFVRHFVYDKLH